MKNKVLLIDDKITAETSLGSKINRLAREAGFELIFAQTWKDEGYNTKAIDILQKDPDIRLILLDVLFPGQRFEGGAIFNEIKKMKPDLPVVILTNRDVYTEAEEFLERGAHEYIVKSSFERRTTKLLNYLHSFSTSPENLATCLVLKKRSPHLYYMDVLDEKGYSILKRRRTLKSPLLNIILGAAKNDNKSIDFPETTKDGIIEALKPWNRTDVQKEIWKFNKSIRDSSNGRFHSLLKGLGIHGASAFKLLVGKVIIEENQGSNCLYNLGTKRF